MATKWCTFTLRAYCESFLNDTFSFSECIGRLGTTARSQYLTPTDFAVWVILKDKVYSEKIWDQEHLKERSIASEFDKL